MSNSGKDPVPFAPRTAPDVMEDLRTRLRMTRWPDAPEDAGWSLGTDLGYLRELVEYWIDGFDWEAREAALGELPRFRASVDGVGIHFVHAKAVAPPWSAMPLVLSHGWPDSFWRFSKVIPMLTDPGAYGGDPADAFDVVVPDMPGYGYSDRPGGAPLDSRAVAGMWASLMRTLGYERFGAAGGDVGGQVSRFLALDHPERVVAVHRTDPGLPAFGGDLAALTEEEREWFAAWPAWSRTEGAFAAMQVTRPQTVAFGLSDSPVGLAAWILEKMRAWSDCGGDVEKSFTKDEILTNVMIYWVTGTIGSAMRMYRANAGISAEEYGRRVEVPSGFSLFAREFLTPPRAYLERTTNLAWVSEVDRGGHFAAFEEPELYAAELREFFRPYRGLV
ncbi:epoxide hydrolase family protein [Umezawaea sp. NPDC059074]|uniref:epoxide hydrolase family protein n=1 Tax=Umezawaea sp. NPDC059074 TaxID=3346716 RepID=UPI0036CBC7D8